MQDLVGYWEQGGDKDNYMRIFEDGRISLGLQDGADFYSLDGTLTADESAMYVAPDEDSLSFLKTVPQSGLISVPYSISKSKGGEVASILLQIKGKKFLLEKRGFFLSPSAGRIFSMAYGKRRKRGRERPTGT